MAIGSARWGRGAILGELAVLEHDLVVVGVVPARLRDRADLVAMAAMLGANPYQVRPGWITGGSDRRWR
jgi:hypothetical protein